MGLNYFAEVMRKTALRGEIKEEEFFLNREFKRFVLNMVDSALTMIYKKVKMKNPPHIHVNIVYEENGETAYTDSGSYICLNTCSPLAQYCTQLQNKFEVSLGLVLHEISHILFMDGPGMNKFLNEYRSNGRIPLFNIQKRSPEIQESYKEFKKVSQEPPYRKMFFGELNDLQNIKNDAEDELLISSFVTGFYMGCLNQLDVIHRETMASMEDSMCDLEVWRMKTMKELDEAGIAIEDTSFPALEAKRQIAIIMNQILLYCKYGSLKDGGYIGKERDILSDAMKVVDEFRWDNDTDHIIEFCFLIILTLWDYYRIILDYIDDHAQDNVEKEKLMYSLDLMPKKDDTDYSEQKIPSQAVQESNGGKLLEQKQARSGICKIGQMDESGSTEESEMTRQFEKAMNEVAKNLAENEMEAERREELQKEANLFSQRPEEILQWHRGFHYQIIRPNEPSEQDEEKYFATVKSDQLDLVAKSLSRKIRKDLDERKMNSKLTGQYYGRLDRKRLYLSNEGNCFYRNVLPGELNIAIAVVMDQSGSMRDFRIRAVQKMAMIVEMFTRELEIPCLLYGHTTKSGKIVPLYLYKDFDSFSTKDRFRLMSMTDYSGSRDGFVIWYGIERLMKRSEQCKLLIVITDGKPMDRCNPDPALYLGGDMKAIIKRGREAGIKIIGAAIGDDKKQLEHFYGADYFLDISNLEDLPQKMVQLIKQYIRY